MSKFSGNLALSRICNCLKIHKLELLPWRGCLARRGLSPWQRFVTRYLCQFLPGALGRGGAAIHRPHECVAGTGSPQADRQEHHFPRVRNLLVAFGPADELPPADVEIARQCALPPPSEDG